tara:strand:- start:1973 stop:2242 length:270 start_codon:yes stop_codon:yes gene_type:complete
MKNRYGNVSALKDFVLGGSKISKLEALVLFGVQDLSREMKRLKDNGFIVKKETVLFIKALKRINMYTVCKVPKDLPTKEILITEYWISQ